jgi:hypothetical protein
MFTLIQSNALANDSRVTVGMKTILSILLIIVLAVVAVADIAQAQRTSKIHRIGFLSGGFPGPSHWTARLSTELQRIGYTEAKSYQLKRASKTKLTAFPRWLRSCSTSSLMSSLTVALTTPAPPRTPPRRFPLLERA